MKKQVFIAFYLLFICIIKSQTEIKQNTIQIIFKGEPNLIKKSELEQGLMQIPFVSAAKLYYKPEKNAGEIILIINRDIRSKGEEIEEFNPISVKNYLIQNNLEIVELNRKD
ncbi:MAG: hypothetical protein N3F09_01895 [Bacteroidia bacterium]|nr:hypothetical protein [Bacteroidia bacterium]